MVKKSWSCLLVWTLLVLPEIAFPADKIPIDTGSTAWMLISTGLVLLMVPGLAMFYGGLVRTKNVLGTLSSLVCYGAILAKYKLGYDDTLDVFGVHGVGSGLGVLLLSFFIRPSWLAEAAQKAGGPWTAWNQLGVQAAGIGITIVYAALLTWLLVWLINKLLGFRLEEQEEMIGMDQSLHGEQGYGFLG